MAGSVLLVDDEPVVLSVLARGLREAGYHVVTATNGEAALEQLHRAAFDLLITDMVMPGMSGSELTERAGVEFPTLKIIQLTGYTPPERRRGHTPMLMKPFDLATLLQEVAAALDRPK
jgi:CheY-like chemotaxis protein